MEAELSPGEIVLAILNFVRQKRFSADREKIHSFFLKMRKDYPQLLKTIGFRDGIFCPESSFLDQALANLIAGRILEQYLGQPRYYELTNRINEAFEQYIQPKLSPKAIKICQRIAAEFENELSVKYN